MACPFDSHIGNPAQFAAGRRSQGELPRSWEPRRLRHRCRAATRSTPLRKLTLGHNRRNGRRSRRKRLRARGASRPQSPERTKRSPPEIARAWGISVAKVLAWIKAGELLAVNAATRATGRPRYLVDVEDLADFAARRSTVSPPLPKSHRRRQPAEVIEFF
jgi:hypothetical protein